MSAQQPGDLGGLPPSPLQGALPVATVDAEALQRVAAVALKAAAAPVRSWRRELLYAGLATTGLSVLVLVATGLGGVWSPGTLTSHAPALAVLLLAQLTGVYGAMAPDARRAGLASLACAALAMAALVGLRAPDPRPLAFAYHCTLAHVALVAGPLALVLALQRRALLTPLRGLTAGVAAGGIGALAGEFACRGGAAHVALFHLPVWMLALAIGASARRWLRPRTFAP